MVSFVQFVLIFLIINFEFTMTLKHANSFLMIIPRFISAMMMHLQVEADTRNGLHLMKYVVNHPESFKGYIVKDRHGNVVKNKDGTPKTRVS